MRCLRCHHENPPRAKFCEECAAPLAQTCANCGSAIGPTAKFCPECAHPVTRPPGAQTRYASPKTYMPEHLAERIRTSRSALEGERKQVTVLFADMKGSMELLADRDPEDARKLLDPVLERMVEAVHRYEGTVNQVMGDGIMALFGAPVAHEDHAQRACYAALDMQAALQRYAGNLRRTEGFDVQVRIGLNSGEVVVRSIGSDLRMDYSAVGLTTHLAGRMEQLARPGTTLLTRDTLRLAEGYVEVRPLGPVPVKGSEAPVEVYELNGVGRLRSRLQAVAARGLTRFVGRDVELEQLHRALARAGAGHGQVVAVVGEPGVGKSRLVWELMHSHRTHDWLILHASAVSYGKTTPYLPLIDLFRRYFRLEDRDDHRAIHEKVIGKLLTLDEALRSELPTVLALLDVPVEETSWQALDPPQRRQRTLDAVKRLLLRESGMQPLVLVFEDLHWIDTETQAVLDSLIESLPTARVLLLVNYRPEYEHPWGRKTYYTQLHLDPLAPESAEAFLQALLGGDAALQPLKQILIERTEGNPFFLEESVRTLVETGMLAGEPGAYRLARPVEGIRIPATVQAVLAARIDRLAPEHKRLLECAAVVGKDVPFPLLQPIAEMAEPELRRGLAELQAAEFLYETSLYPDLAYTFKHALTHEVAYGTLLHEQRRALHARIVEAIERLYEDRLAEQIERLAHHAYCGEVWGKAVEYLRQAGAKAMTRALLREAAGYFEKALLALRHLPEDRDTLAQAIDLRFDLRNSYQLLGEHARVLEHLQSAEPLARALDDPHRLGRLLGYLSGYFFFVGELSQGKETGERALAIAETIGDGSLGAEMKLRLSMVHQSHGDFDRVTELTEHNVAHVTGERARAYRIGANLTSVVSRVWLAQCLTERGQFARAIAVADEALRFAEAVPNTHSMAVALVGLGIPHKRRGDFRQAIPVLERGVTICRDFDFDLWLSWARGHLGSAYALSGRLEEAFPLLKEAIEHPRRVMVHDGFFTAALGKAHWLAGNLDDAMALACRGLELTRQRRQLGDEAWILCLLGDIHSARGPADAEAAARAYEAALRRASELGMRPLMAHCHFGLGTLQQTDNGPQAQAHLDIARTMYADMGMDFWLAEANRQAPLRA